MARLLIPVDAIYTRGLELLDAEGPSALQARRRAADLKICMRTLYQQVGNQERLTRALVPRHFSQLRLGFQERKTWESSVTRSDTDLRAHPGDAREKRAHPPRAAQ